jgi:formylglycine-generating enzyme required for sulfatase activity
MWIRRRKRLKNALMVLAACALHAGFAWADGSGTGSPPYEPEMVRIPAGAFEMGSARGEPGREGDEAPRHTVRIARPLHVSKYEITEAQWDACVADKACAPLRLRLGPSYPATTMRWDDAHAYLNWLSAKTGKRYRFLTEAEWEYAARAGAGTAYITGETIRPDQANYAASGYGKARPVGQYAPNRFGLFDVHGNVWEWVADCFSENGYYGAPADGTAVTRANCHAHVVRGGAFDTRPGQLRSAYRFNSRFGDETVGLRVAMEEAQ